MAAARDAGWLQLGAAILPGRLERATVRGTAGAAFPIVDFEPQLEETFYDRTPYDFDDPQGWRSSSMLEELVARQPPRQRRLDAGCGAGRNLPCLQRGTTEIVAVDLSLRSVCRVACRFGVRAGRCSTLDLPFVDASFDLVVCDGVAHHTPDPARALAEVARVTRPGGYIYAALYRSATLYSRLYRHVGGGLRAARRLAESRSLPDIDRLAFFGYRLATRAIKRGRTRDEASLRALYEDYFHTPIASFHDRGWIEATLAAAGAPVEFIEPHANVWRLVARKGSPAVAAAS